MGNRAPLISDRYTGFPCREQGCSQVFQPDYAHVPEHIDDQGRIVRRGVRDAARLRCLQKAAKLRATHEQAVHSLVWRPLKAL